MAKKALKTLERDHNVLFTSDLDLDARYSEEEFAELMSDNSITYVGVNFEDREQFLKDNGYEVTRETLIDATLESKPKE